VEPVGTEVLYGKAAQIAAKRAAEGTPTVAAKTPEQVAATNMATQILAGRMTLEQVPEAAKSLVSKTISQMQQQTPTEPARSARQIAADNMATQIIAGRMAETAVPEEAKTMVSASLQKQGYTPPDEVDGPFGYGEGLKGWEDFVQRTMGMSLDDFGSQFGIVFNEETGKPELNIPVAATNYWESALGQEVETYAHNYMAGLPDLINLYRTQDTEALASSWRDGWKLINENVSKLGIGSDGAAILMMTMGNRNLLDSISKMDLNLLIKQKEFSKEGADFALDLMKYGEGVRAAKEGEARGWVETMMDNWRTKMTVSRDTYDALTRLGFDAAAQNIAQNGLDLQYRIGAFNDIGDLMDRGLITPEQGASVIDAILTARTTGNWGPVDQALRESGVDPETLGLYQSLADVSVELERWTSLGYVANMVEKTNANGDFIGWDVVPIMQVITRADGTTALGLFRPKDNVQLDALISRAAQKKKKITATIQPNGNVEYAMSTEALEPGETITVLGDGTIIYTKPVPVGTPAPAPDAAVPGLPTDWLTAPENLKEDWWKDHAADYVMVDNVLTWPPGKPTFPGTILMPLPGGGTSGPTVPVI
jgi:hypothetical protein